MPDFPPTVNITTKPSPAAKLSWTCGVLKGTRQKVIDDINASGLSAARKALLIEEIGEVDAKHDLIRVDFHRHKFNGGSDGKWTVTEL